MNFLHQDTPMTRLLNFFLDLVLLNVFWVVCSLPLVTIGASTAALYDVLMTRIAEEPEGGSVRDFFPCFRRHLRQGTVLFLLLVLAGIFLAVDFFAATLWNTPFSGALKLLILAAGYFYAAVAVHALPTLVWFGEPVGTALRHAFLLAMRNGIFTVYIMLLNLIPFLLLFLRPLLFWRSIILWVVVGVALTAWLCALHLVRLFSGDGEKQRR